MARAPLQVLVFPFRRLLTDGTFAYAVFRRADHGYWQAIAGGGEDDETPLAAARREAWEETHIPPSAAYAPLATHVSVALTVIAAAARAHWPPDRYVIPAHVFAVACDEAPLRLSREHTAVRWMDYAQAARFYTGTATGPRCGSSTSGCCAMTSQLRANQPDPGGQSQHRTQGSIDLRTNADFGSR